MKARVVYIGGKEETFEVTDEFNTNSPNTAGLLLPNGDRVTLSIFAIKKIVVSDS